MKTKGGLASRGASSAGVSALLLFRENATALEFLLLVVLLDSLEVRDFSFIQYGKFSSWGSYVYRIHRNFIELDIYYVDVAF